MNLLRQLTEKPWLTPHDALDLPAASWRFPMEKAKVGLMLFLFVVTMLFLLLIVAYAGRMLFEDWRPGPQIGLLWLNTGLLFGCSVALHCATTKIRRRLVDDARWALLTGAALGVAFLIGQCLAWQQLSRIGTFGLALPSVAFFYLITGLHGLHIIGGLVALGTTAARWSDGTTLAVNVQRVELCTIYWHFLFGIWVVLFGLLFSGNNMSDFLVLCGLK